MLNETDEIIKKLEKKLEDKENYIMELEDEKYCLEDNYDDIYSKYLKLKDIPEQLTELLNNSTFDVGTIIELEEKIKEVLKKHGYKSLI